MPDTTVTALRPDPRNEDRVRVMVGPRRVATLSPRSIIELGVAVGREWTETMAAGAQASEQADRAVQKARGYLARRPHTRKQLDLKLAKAKFEPPARREALDRLDHAGLLDDLAFATRYVEELRNRKGAGPRLIQNKLRAAGVSDQTIAQVTQQTEADELNDAARALEYARKQMAGLARLAPDVRQRRLFGRLARRGYDTDTIRNVVDQLTKDDNPN
ncbi:MAG: regulatory protein RecX [Phycisphaeraceae bacterium]